MYDLYAGYVECGSGPPRPFLSPAIKYYQPPRAWYDFLLTVFVHCVTWPIIGIAYLRDRLRDDVELPPEPDFQDYEPLQWR